MLAGINCISHRLHLCSVPPPYRPRGVAAPRGTLLLSLSRPPLRGGASQGVGQWTSGTVRMASYIDFVDMVCLLPAAHGASRRPAAHLSFPGHALPFAEGSHGHCLADPSRSGPASYETNRDTLLLMRPPARPDAAGSRVGPNFVQALEGACPAPLRGHTTRVAPFVCGRGCPTADTRGV